MKIYRLLLCIYLGHSIFALEAEITQKVKVKKITYTCLFKIFYEENACLANSKVSCSPKVKGKKKIVTDVKLALDDKTEIYIKKLRLKGKSAKIIGCKATRPSTDKRGSRPSICSHDDKQFYPDPLDCDKFYQCSEGHAPIQRPCPPGTRLSFELQIFVHAATVDCSTQATCGMENIHGKRISGGTEADPNQYPWMVRIDPPGCGGALITDRHVLTARHCVEEGNDYWRGEMVKVGVHNQYDHTDYQEFPIKEIKWPCITPDRGYPDHDIAIVILEQPVDLNDKKLGTVCLPASDNEDYRGQKTLAMGWGWTPVKNDQATFLQKLEMEVAQRSSKNWLYTKVPFKNGIPLDTCRGDSGGPLVHNKAGRWTVIGTVESGDKDCDDHTGIADGREARWNKVTDHLAWIKSVIGN